MIEEKVLDKVRLAVEDFMPAGVMEIGLTEYPGGLQTKVLDVNVYYGGEICSFPIDGFAMRIIEKILEDKE